MELDDLLQMVPRYTSDAMSISELVPGQLPRIVYINPAFTRLMGYTPEEAMGKTPALWHGPQTDPVTVTALVEALKAGETMTAEIIHYTRERKERCVELTVAPITAEDGRHTHCISCAKDISER